MRAEELLKSTYDRFGPPALANFALHDLPKDRDYRFGAFALADHDGSVVLIRRRPIKQYPGLEEYWWIPGGAREPGEQLDQTAGREFMEETGMGIEISRTLLVQVFEDSPFVAVFFRAVVVEGAFSSSADPDGATAEVRSFLPGGVPFGKLWTDLDKILLVREGFATGEIESLIGKGGLSGPGL